MLDEPAQHAAGVSVLLAVASRTPGAQLLLAESVAGHDNPVSQDDLSRYLRGAVASEATRAAANAVLRKWEAFVAEGALGEDQAVRVSAYALAPQFQDDIMRNFMDTAPSRETYWGKVFYAAAELDTLARQAG